MAALDPSLECKPLGLGSFWNSRTFYTNEPFCVIRVMQVMVWNQCENMAACFGLWTCDEAEKRGFQISYFPPLLSIIPPVHTHIWADVSRSSDCVSHLIIFCVSRTFSPLWPPARPGFIYKPRVYDVNGAFGSQQASRFGFQDCVSFPKALAVGRIAAHQAVSTLGGSSNPIPKLPPMWLIGCGSRTCWQ